MASTIIYVQEDKVYKTISGKLSLWILPLLQPKLLHNINIKFFFNYKKNYNNNSTNLKNSN